MIRRFPQLGEATIPEVLLHRARVAADRTAAVMVHAGQADEEYTFGELLLLAERYAAVFRERAEAGSQSLICVCLYHGIQLHAAFLGGLLAGHVPSMIAPPSPRMERDKYVRSFVNMLDHLRPDIVVTEHSVLEALRGLDVDSLRGRALIDAADCAAAGPAIALSELRAPRVAPDDVAFLQHSSGTTGLQKGVALSHRSVLHQVRSYGRTLDLAPQDVIASWLPLYHDMGLIACLVTPLLTGVPVIELSPFEWVNQPALLPERIERYGATLCWLPNFAYSFMSKAIREHQLERGSFASVRAFVNCSEPVMAASHREFARRFAARGVRAEQLTACYAMAENVFAVTQSPLGSAPRLDRIDRERFETEHRAEPAGDAARSLELVSNGPPIAGVEVRIADEADRPCPERQVGEILIRGESLFSGYYRRDDLTRQVFSGDWYRTGDLGYLADGELYVTGRKKDLIIIQGRNFYPSDLESLVSEIPGILRGRVVAFGDTDADSGTEALVILAETKVEDPAERGRLNLQIRNQIAQSFDCTVGGVHLVPARWMVKSTSGKVARPDNRRKYETSLKK